MHATYEAPETIVSRVEDEAFARDVWEGLSREPKSVPATYLYDAAGSRLFQRITELEEYYLTRCEQQVLETHAVQIAAMLAPGPWRVIEPGAGDGRKTEILLRQFLARGLPREYVPIDICRQAVLDLAGALHGRLGLGAFRVRGIVADYSDAFAMLRRQHRGRNLVLFLGSNIGNFTHPQARKFLGNLREALGPGDHVLLGFDLKKDPALLQRAYDDAEGVTREFNFNLLDRINRELDGRFDRRRFAHHAAYNARRACMESWLISREDQEVRIDALARAFTFRAWEGIHVESSYKYDLADIEGLAAYSGFLVRKHFLDERGYFADSLWQVPE